MLPRPISANTSSKHVNLVNSTIRSFCLSVNDSIPPDLINAKLSRRRPNSIASSLFNVFSAWRIRDRALALTTKFSQLALGRLSGEVIISTVWPLLKG